MSDGRGIWAVATTADVSFRAQQVHQAAFGPRPKRVRAPSSIPPPGTTPPGGPRGPPH
ncbi:MAG: hypothetical protein L3J73_03505 [Thermoplasmata archaeon]|nr:hypothetical protein [Thermoplasmata archaeon]